MAAVPLAQASLARCPCSTDGQSPGVAWGVLEPTGTLTPIGSEGTGASSAPARPSALTCCPQAGSEGVRQKGRRSDLADPSAGGAQASHPTSPARAEILQTLSPPDCPGRSRARTEGPRPAGSQGASILTTRFWGRSLDIGAPELAPRHFTTFDYCPFILEGSFLCLPTICFSFTLSCLTRHSELGGSEDSQSRPALWGWAQLAVALGPQQAKGCARATRCRTPRRSGQRRLPWVDLISWSPTTVPQAFWRGLPPAWPPTSLRAHRLPPPAGAASPRSHPRPPWLCWSPLCRPRPLPEAQGLGQDGPLVPRGSQDGGRPVGGADASSGQAQGRAG